jgi:hypothetical protein
VLNAVQFARTHHLVVAVRGLTSHLLSVFLQAKKVTSRCATVPGDSTASQ